MTNPEGSGGWRPRGLLGYHRVVAHEGLNPDDPGIRLLADEVAGISPAELVLVCSGPLPGLGPGATRLISDVRELPPLPQDGEDGEDGELCLPFTFDEPSEPSEPSSATPGPVLGRQLASRFSAAVVWPRAHLGKDFSLACIARGALLLRAGGRLLCAARKNKGAPSLAAAIRRLLGEPEVLRRDRGYHLYAATLRGPDAIDRAYARELLGLRHRFEDPLLGGSLVATPGVFSRKGLDRGSRALLHWAAELADRGALGEPRRILDLCAGVGPLGLWAAQRWPGAHLTAVDSNLLAIASLQQNARDRGLCDGPPRIAIHAADGLAGLQLRPFDLALINPPTHAGESELRALLAPLPPLLGGKLALFVVNRAGRLLGLLAELGAHTEVTAADGYALVTARW